MQGKLAQSPGGCSIQAFPLLQGTVNLTSGTYIATVARCVAAGNLTITWQDGTTAVIACVAGDYYSIPAGPSCTVSSGTFHLA